MRRNATMVLLLVPALSACAPGSATPSPDPYTPGTEDVDALDPFVAEPEWNAEEMTAAVHDLLLLGFPDPQAPYDAYRTLLTFRDETCPNEGDQLIGQEMPEGGCTAASGVHYEGNTVIVEIDQSDAGGVVQGFQFGGDFLIEDAEGHALAGGGSMRRQVSVAGNGRRDWNGEAAGTWVHTLRDDWLGLGTSATLNFQGAVGGEDDRLYLDGTLGVGGVYVHFVEVTWREACGGAPTGKVRVRDPSGVWSELDFADRCDGCGAWTVEGVGEPAEACLDLEPYRAAIEELGTW